MKNILLFIALGTALPFSAFSQENQLLSGRIFAPDLEESTVHIINITQGTGTVNSSSGNFKIQVRQNDTLLFSSIQYNKMEIPVTAEVLNREVLIVELTEDINELAEVNLSNLSLTGNLGTDVANIELDEALSLNLNFGNLMHAHFKADLNDPLKAPVHLAARQNEIRYGEEIINLKFGIDRLANLVRLKGKSMPASAPAVLASVQIRKLFDDEFFISSLGIKEEHIKDFIFSLDDAALPQNLFKPEKRLALIDFLIAHGKMYSEAINSEK